jgi:hypothetical protein
MAKILFFQKLGPVILHAPVALEGEIRKLHGLHGILITFLLNVDHVS